MRRWGVLLLALALVRCAGDTSGAPPRQTSTAAPAPVFEDVAEVAGVRQKHLKPQLDPVLENIMPWMQSVGAAAAAGDYDGDGWLDLYVTSSDRGSPNFLYHNEGNGTFSEVAAKAGIAAVNNDDGASMDVLWADLDNDGRLDLYLVRWGRNALFHNNGDGTFTEVTAKQFRRRDGSPGTDWANGNAVAAFDYDRDGRLDLYVGNYFRDVDLWHLATTRIMHDDFEAARNAGPNFLFHQRADGTFEELAARFGVDDTGWTLDVGAADLDNDGWPDLYAANDFGPDQLFLNREGSGFANVTEQALGRDTRKGMNVDFGDFNNDGWLDIYVTNITTPRYLQEGNMLWRNNGPDENGLVRFMDVSPESGTFDGGWGWGAKFLDWDHDGDLDLYTVNGFVSAGEGSYWYDLATWTVEGVDVSDSRNWPTIGDRSFSGYEKSRFWRNDGNERFAEIAEPLGVASELDGRGVVVWDYDEDGDLDLFVANQGDFPHLYRNSGPDGHWLLVAPVADPATGVNADAIGTRVTVVTESGAQIRERECGAGYAGQSDPRLHFGLGRSERVQLIEIRWPDGGLQYLENVAADQLLTVEQDPAAYVSSSRTSVSLPARREPAAGNAAPAGPQLAPEDLDRLLSGFEAELARNSAQHGVAYTYRQRAVENGAHDRPIAFFEKLVAERPRDRWARLELSVAYVDKMPSRGGLAAVVSKGTLARQSLDVLDTVVADHPDWWPAYYGRGMNHLHWPWALGHTDEAVADFRRCLELQRPREGAGAPAWFVRTYLLLGDALAKLGSYGEARETWSEGLERHPGNVELEQRLALADEAAIEAFVARSRSLETTIDTDFSFLGPDYD